jgi:leader peptidase (prepilin peptidase)/N-methyltransferase
MDWVTQHLPLIVWCAFVLALGLMVGSFINVLVARLPYEKSVVWPSSRCFACFRPVRMLDNVPVLGYLRLGGKCRHCAAPFAARYMWVELGTGLAFLTLFLAEVVFDRFALPGVRFNFRGFQNATPSVAALGLFVYHALLLSALIAAAVVDLEHRVIPTQITYPALVVGIIGGALMPWPWPHPEAAVNAIPAGMPWYAEQTAGKVPLGVQLWPFWGPTFDFAPPGSWQMGLTNSVLGALIASVVVRATKWLFETGFGREALGLGDADLLMMSGAFLGWQIPVLALFVGSFVSLILKVLEYALGAPDAPPASGPLGTPVTGPPEARELPFGPGLAIGVAITWFAWPWLGPRLQFPFFDQTAMGLFVGIMCVGLLAAALLLRRPVETEPVAK